MARVVVFVCLVVLVVLGIRLLVGEDGVQEEPPTPDSRITQSAVVKDPVVSTRVEVRPGENPRDHIELRVTNDSGTPLVSARIHEVPTGNGRTIESSRLGLLAETDANGVAAIQSRALTGLRVSKPGFVPEYVALDDSSDQSRIISVALAAGADLTIIVSDVHGNPVPDVHFALSHAPVGGLTEPFRDTIPGVDESDAIYQATSNRNGIAAIGDLLLGRYYVNPVPNSLPIVDGQSFVTIQHGGDNVVQFTVGSVVGVGIEVRGRDELLAVFLDAETPYGPGVIPDAVRKATDLIASRLGISQEHALAVIPDSSAVDSDGSAKGVLRMFWRYAGWRETEVLLTPLHGITEPVWVVGDPSQPDKTKAVTIYLTWPDGSPADLGELYLVPIGQSATTAIGSRFTQAETIRVPVGEYRLSAVDLVLAKSMGLPLLSVTTDLQKTIQLPQKLVRHEFEILMDGVPYVDGHMEFVITGGGHRFHYRVGAGGSGRISTLVPDVDSIELVVSIPGIGRKSQTIGLRGERKVHRLEMAR